MPYSGTGELICPHILMTEEKADGLIWSFNEAFFASHVFALPFVVFMADSDNIVQL